MYYIYGTHKFIDSENSVLFTSFRDNMINDRTFDKLKTRLATGGYTQDRQDIVLRYKFSYCIHPLHNDCCKHGSKRASSRTITRAYLIARISKHEICMELGPTMELIVCRTDRSYDKSMIHNRSIIVLFEKILYKPSSGIDFYLQLSKKLATKPTL